jgi:hypothetical protein
MDKQNRTKEIKESTRKRRDFPHPFRLALGPTQPAVSKAHRISFPGVMRPAHGLDHPLPYSAEVKEIVELYLYFPL